MPALDRMQEKTLNSIDQPDSVDPDFAGIFYPTEDNAYFGTNFLIEADEVTGFGAMHQMLITVCRPNEQMDANLYYETYKADLNNKSIKVKMDGLRLLSRIKNHPLKPALKIGWRQVG